MENKKRMREFKKYHKEIFEEIRGAPGVALMLDFDGVLSEIVPTPSAAVIAPKAAQTLRVCAARFPTAVISGRSLEGLSERVPKIPGLILSGNHGTEWDFGGRLENIKVPRRMKRAAALARKKLRPLAARYPKIVIERKEYIVVCHYRPLSRGRTRSFQKEARAVLAPIARAYKMRLDHDPEHFEFELRPDFWDKGDIVRHIVDYVRGRTGQKILPIYIGDALTDEDAFRALRQGITIRVGRAARSAARYFFRRRYEVDRFLKQLAKLFAPNS